MGIMVPGFPNFGMLLGPNTGLGHNSVVLMIEAQVDYLMGCLDRMLEGPLEVSDRAMDRFAQEMRTRLSGSVWNQGGCRSWYLDEEGRNVTLWPGQVTEYQRRTRRVDERAFTPRPAAAAEAQASSRASPDPETAPPSA